MATQQSLLEKPKKPVSKTICLLLSVIAVLSSSAFVASYIFKPSSVFNDSSLNHVCDHALDTTSCLAHISELTQTHRFNTAKPHKFDLLKSFLIKHTSDIEKAMGETNAIRLRVNNPREEAALKDCVDLMELSLDRVWNSMLALTKQTTESHQDAHTWLSSVLTNHATCLDGLEGAARSVMEDELEDLKSRSRTALAILVETVLPPKIIDEPLNGDFPSWVSSRDRRLLESGVGDVKANVVVAQDGSGKFKTVTEAVASAPDNGKTRYVIYVKKGTYKEHVEIGKKKKNIMLVGDGMDATIITGSLNFIDGTTTFNSATVGMCLPHIFPVSLLCLT